MEWNWYDDVYVRTYFLPRRFAQLTNLHSTFTHFHTSSGLLDLFPVINLYELTFRNYWITAESWHSNYGLLFSSYSWKSYILCVLRMLIGMFCLIRVELLYGVSVCWSSFVRYILTKVVKFLLLMRCVMLSIYRLVVAVCYINSYPQKVLVQFLCVP